MGAGSLGQILLGLTVITAVLALGVPAARAVPRPEPTPSRPPSLSPDIGENTNLAWWDVPGQVGEAINDWFENLVTSAVNPTLSLLGASVLSTPDVSGIERVRQLWQMTLTLTNTIFVLFVLVGGVVLMSHETLQTRYTLHEVAPRLVVAFVSANVSLWFIGMASRLANGLSTGLMGQGLDPRKAADTLTNMLLGAIGTGRIFLVLLGLVAAVLGVIVVLTLIVRIALVILLTVAAPLALACHALPQTDGIAQLWWRALAGCLVVQIGQSLVLITALRVFFGGNGTTLLGLPTASGLIDLLVAICLLYVLVRIPFWAHQMIFRGKSAPGSMVVRLVKYRIIHKALKTGKAAGALIP